MEKLMFSVRTVRKVKNERKIIETDTVTSITSNIFYW